jgi:hypothetical protein
MKRLRISVLSMIVGLATVLSPSATVRASLAAQDAPSAKTPVVVFIIRHAEKPVGEGKDPNLTPQGFERARALPSLFVMTPGANQPARFPRPNYLFAAAATKGSNRPIETITPLAQTLRLGINHDYVDAETGPLAKELMSGRYAGKVVVVSWHHGEIPHLAQALGVTDAPKHWDPAVFDRIWEVRWENGQAHLTILPQHLLPGDAAQ